MKLIEYTDERGRTRRSLLRDDDPPEWAAQGRGIPQDPPDLDQLDWEQARVDLHNELAVRGLLGFDDVQGQRGGLNAAIRAALLPKLMLLYRTGGQ
jgi:hypothetical protein